MPLLTAVNELPHNQGVIISNALTFGKFKGKTVEEVFSSDPSYCQWMNSQPSLNISEDIKLFLYQKFHNNDNSYMMNWGKYKGKSIKQIRNIDPKYLDWLRTNQYVIDNCPRLYKELY